MPKRDGITPHLGHEKTVNSRSFASLDNDVQRSRPHGE
jgi:hypothetical protein